MINDGMEAHRDEHTHSIRPRLQQGAVKMRRSSGGGGEDGCDDVGGGYSDSVDDFEAKTNDEHYI